MPAMTSWRIVGIVPMFVAAACVVEPADPLVSHREDALKAAEQGRVTICHKPNSAEPPTTIVVAAPAVSAHLHHGDALGECSNGCSATSCDDRNACTMDSCLPTGGCAHVAVACDDGNPCTTDLCDSVQGCITTPTPVTTSCDDGNACTGPDRCVGVACVGSAIARCCQNNGDCNDQNACTTNVCQDHECIATNVNCMVPDACIAGFCDPGTGACGAVAITCDDGNPCTEDGCDSSTGCTHRSIPGCGQACCATGALVDCANTGAGTRCHTGTSDGQECIGSVGTSAEVCNNVDDDCDGLVDDVPGIGTPCASGGVNTGGVCRAELACLGTPGPGPSALTCVQVVGPTAETCNGVDDNCNGVIDDVPGGCGSCPAGQYRCPSTGNCATSCSVCPGAAAACNASMQCVASCGACSGLPNACQAGGVMQCAGAPCRPDITGHSLSCGDAVRIRPMFCTLTIQNVGDAPAAPSRLALRAFGNGAFIITDVPCFVPSLAPGESVTTSCGGPVPLSLPTGETHMEAILDATNVVEESNELNNSVYTSFFIL